MQFFQIHPRRFTSAGVACKIFIAVGLLFLSIGIGVGVYDYIKRSASQEYTGEVIDFQQDKNGISPRNSTRSTSRNRGSIVWRPVVKWQDGNQSHTFTSSAGSSPPSYKIGDKVTVLAKKGDPTSAQIDSFNENWLFPLIFGLFGILAIAISWPILRYWNRRQQKIQRLTASGTRVPATVVSAVANESYTVNNKTPWEITAEWAAPNGGKLQFHRKKFLAHRPIVVGEIMPVVVNLALPTDFLFETEIPAKKST